VLVPFRRVSAHSLGHSGRRNSGAARRRLRRDSGRRSDRSSGGEKVHVSTAGDLAGQQLALTGEGVRLHPLARIDDVAAVLGDHFGCHEAAQDLRDRALVGRGSFGESLLRPFALGRCVGFETTQSGELDHDSLGQPEEVRDRSRRRRVYDPFGGGRLANEHDRRRAGQGQRRLRLRRTGHRLSRRSGPSGNPTRREPYRPGTAGSGHGTEDEPEECVHPPFTPPSRSPRHGSGKEEAYGRGSSSSPSGYEAISRASASPSRR